MTSVATAEAAAAMLISEHEQTLGQMATSILQVNEAGEGRIRGNLHGEVNHPIKDVAKGNWTTRPNWAMWATSQSILRAWVQPETRTRDRESAGDQP
jgi:hypothetical protein